MISLELLELLKIYLMSSLCFLSEFCEIVLSFYYLILMLLVFFESENTYYDLNFGLDY